MSFTLRTSTLRTSTLRTSTVRTGTHRTSNLPSTGKRTLIATVVMVGATQLFAPVALGEGLTPATPAVNTATRNAIRNVICGPSGRCTTCPDYTTGESGQPITVGTIHLGSFINAGAKEAYVALFGCEERPYNSVGSVLLRNTGGRWRFVRYDRGVNVNTCQRFDYDGGTVVLTCNDSSFGQGYVIDSVYAIYTGPKKTSTVSLLTAQTNEETCQGTIDRVVLTGWRQRDTNGDGDSDLVVSVEESHADRPGAGECEEAADTGRVQRYDLIFLFDGKRFTPAPRSARTVKCLEDDSRGLGVPGTYCPSPS
jgi:hypothetical protein